MEVSLIEEDFDCLWVEDSQTDKYVAELTESQLSEETAMVFAAHIENLAFIFATQKRLDALPNYFQLYQEVPLEAIEELKASAQCVEIILAQHGLKFAEHAGGRIVLISKKPWYKRRACPWNWYKPIMNEVEKAGRNIEHVGEYAGNPAYREAIKLGEKGAKETRYSNLVHSEKEIKKAAADVRRELEMLIQKSPKGLDGLWDNAVGYVEARYSGNPVLIADGGRRMIKGVMKLRDYGIETKSFFAVQSNYNKLVTENREASYQRCIAEGYQPKLIFHPNPTQVLGTSFMDLNMGLNGPEIIIGLDF